MDTEGTEPTKSSNGSTIATIINSSGSWGKVTKSIQPNVINPRSSTGNFSSSCNIVNTTSNLSSAGFSKDEPPRKESRLLHYCHICNKGFKVNQLPSESVKIFIMYYTFDYFLHSLTNKHVVLWIFRIDIQLMFTLERTQERNRLAVRCVGNVSGKKRISQNIIKPTLPNSNHLQAHLNPVAHK